MYKYYLTSSENRNILHLASDLLWK